MQIQKLKQRPILPLQSVPQKSVSHSGNNQNGHDTHKPPLLLYRQQSTSPAQDPNNHHEQETTNRSDDIGYNHNNSIGTRIRYGCISSAFHRNTYYSCINVVMQLYHTFARLSMAFFIIYGRKKQGRTCVLVSRSCSDLTARQAEAGDFLYFKYSRRIDSTRAPSGIYSSVSSWQSHA